MCKIWYRLVKSVRWLDACRSIRNLDLYQCPTAITTPRKESFENIVGKVNKNSLLDTFNYSSQIWFFIWKQYVQNSRAYKCIAVAKFRHSVIIFCFVLADVRDMFNIIDKNNDKSISLDELAQYLRSLEINMTYKELKEAVGKLDSNSKYVIVWIALWIVNTCSSFK